MMKRLMRRVRELRQAFREWSWEAEKADFWRMVLDWCDYQEARTYQKSWDEREERLRGHA